MLASERDMLLRRSRDWLTAFADDAGKVVKRLNEYRGGYPSGRQGDKPVDPKADWAEGQLRELDREITSIFQRARKLNGLRQEVLATTSLKSVDPGCEIVLKHAPGGPDDEPAYEPTHRFGDVGERLKSKRRLGRWAYEQVLNNGEPGDKDDSHLPTKEETLAHLAGKRVVRGRSAGRRAS